MRYKKHLFALTLALVSVGFWNFVLPPAGQAGVVSEPVLESQDETLKLWKSSTAEGKDKLFKGDLAQGETLLNAALSASRQLKDRDLTATSLSNLAQLERAKGDLIASEKYSRQSLHLLSPGISGSGRGLAYAIELTNLAATLKEQGQFVEAASLYQAASAIFVQVQGADSIEVATVNHNLAALYQKFHKHKEAIDSEAKAVAIYEQKLGTSSPDLAIALGTMAESYRELGEGVKARTLYERSLAIMRGNFGERHPAVATAMDNLAGLLARQGKLREAEGLELKALATFKQTLGLDHPDVAICLDNLAYLYIAQGRLDLAKATSEDALSITTRKLGEEHPLSLEMKGRLDSIVEMLKLSD